MNERLLDLLRKLAGHRVAVIGDLVADRFVYGHAGRVSREAPVLVVEHERDQIALGGAANAAHNIKALGGEPIVVGVVGADAQGDLLLAELREKGIDTSYVVRDRERPTVTKERVVASGLHTTYQQLVRIDRGVRRPVAGKVERRLLSHAEKAAGEAEAVVASDYGYGVFSDAMLGRVSALAGSKWCKVLVDSRYQPLRFKEAYLLTPNEPEAGEACGIVIRTAADVEHAAERLLRGADATNVVITRGREGMYLKSHDGSGEFIPIYGTDQIADVTGAGDTVIAAFALAGAVNAPLSLAARLATVAAGLAVMKHGTAVVTPAEIEAALEQNPWLAS